MCIALQDAPDTGTSLYSRIYRHSVGRIFTNTNIQSIRCQVESTGQQKVTKLGRVREH